MDAVEESEKIRMGVTRSYFFAKTVNHAAFANMSPPFHTVISSIYFTYIFLTICCQDGM